MAQGYPPPPGRTKPWGTTHAVLTAAISLGHQHYGTEEKQVQFFNQAEAALRRLPGVTHLAFSDSLPLSGPARSTIYSVIDAGAVRSANAIGYLGAVTAVQAVILLCAVRVDWGRLRAAARAGAGIGIGSVAAYLLVLLAYQRAPASPVATIRELSILLGILIARDRPGKRVWLGGALCVLGAALTVL